MIITHHGKQYLRLQQGDFTLAYNPLSKDSSILKKGEKPQRFGSNLTLVSVRHSNYNGTENTSFGDSEPFVIQGPGSYEVGGVTVNGFGTKALINDESFINTLYFVNIEGITYCFVGDLEDPNLDQHIKEFTDHVDVLVVPIGGKGTLNPNQAAKLVKLFSPKVIIPVDYGVDRDDGNLELFLKELGSHADPVEKFVFKKSDLEKMTGTAVVLKQS